MVEIDKNFKITSSSHKSKKDRNEPPKQVITNIYVYGILSSSEGEEETRFSDKRTKCKKSRLCSKQSVKRIKNAGEF